MGRGNESGTAAEAGRDGALRRPRAVSGAERIPANVRRLPNSFRPLYAVGDSAAHCPYLVRPRSTSNSNIELRTFNNERSANIQRRLAVRYHPQLSTLNPQPRQGALGCVWRRSFRGRLAGCQSGAEATAVQTLRAIRESPGSANIDLRSPNSEHRTSARMSED